MGSCAGIDWASEKHDVLIADAAGEQLLAATFAHDEDGISASVRGAGLLRCRGRRDRARRTGCWSTGCSTPGCGCWRCIPIRSRPHAIASASRAGSLTGLTGSCCASWLAPIAHRFRVLEPDPDQTKAIRALTRAREDLVAARVALANQLRAELERFWPGPVGLFARSDSPISLAFLARYPSPQDTRGLGEKRMAAFLKAQRYTSRKTAGAAARAAALRAGRTRRRARDWSRAARS